MQFYQIFSNYTTEKSTVAAAAICKTNSFTPHHLQLSSCSETYINYKYMFFDSQYTIITKQQEYLALSIQVCTTGCFCHWH